MARAALVECSTRWEKLVISLRIAPSKLCGKPNSTQSRIAKTAG